MECSCKYDNNIQSSNYLAPFKKFNALSKKCNEDRAEAYEIIKNKFNEFYAQSSCCPYPCDKLDLCFLLTLHITDNNDFANKVYKVVGNILNWEWPSIIDKKIPKEELRQLKKMHVLVYLCITQDKDPFYLSKMLIKAAGTNLLAHTKIKKPIKNILLEKLTRNIF